MKRARLAGEIARMGEIHIGISSESLQNEARPGSRLIFILEKHGVRGQWLTEHGVESSGFIKSGETAS